MRRQVRKRRQPRLEKLATSPSKMGVPDIERGFGVGRRRATPKPTAEGFQQSVALPQYPLVVGAYAGQPRPSRDDEVIEETPTFAGIALDNRDVNR